MSLTPLEVMKLNVCFMKFNNSSMFFHFFNPLDPNCSFAPMLCMKSKLPGPGVCTARPWGRELYDACWQGDFDGAYEALEAMRSGAKLRPREKGFRWILGMWLVDLMWFQISEETSHRSPCELLYSIIFWGLVLKFILQNRSFGMGVWLPNVKYEIIYSIHAKCFQWEPCLETYIVL